MNKIYCCILLITFLFFSCRKGTLNNRSIEYIPVSTEALDVKEEEYKEDLYSIISTPIYSSTSNHNNNLSAVASDIDFIALDLEPPLRETLLLQNVELSEDIIFLSWLDGIFSYDNTGKFIERIGGVGQGPEEFVRIATIRLDRDNKLLYGNDMNRRRMIVYRFDGTFKKTFPLKYNESDFVMLDSSTIVWRQSVHDREQNPSMLIRFATNNGEEIKTLWSKYFPLPIREMGGALGVSANPIWNNKDTYYYMEYGTDTIFRILGDALIPTRVLTGNLKLNLTEHFNRNTGNKMRLTMPVMSSNSAIFESNQFLIFRLRSDYEIFFMIYDKSSKQLHRTYHKDASENRFGSKNMDYFVDDMLSGLHINPLYQSMGKAIAVIPAHEISKRKQDVLNFIEKNPNEKSQRFKQTIQTITDDDNPILMIITFK